MAQTSRFWESTSYSDENFAEVMNRFLTDGVIGGVTNELVIGAGTGMQVTVGTGEAFVHGTWYQNDASATLAVTAADPTNPRIDRVVLRRTASSNTLVAAMLDGTPAGSPSAPSLTQSAATWEISLAQVAVAAGATSIVGGNITDERTIKANGVPKNLIAFYTSATVPSGWAEYTAARGRYIVGVPSGGTIAGTIGSAMTDLQDLTHTHTGPSHTHTINTSNGTIGGDAGFSTASATGTGGTATTGTAATSTIAPHIQLFSLKKS